MGTRLTVRVPAELAANAKRYAERHDTTLTRLIVNALRRVPTDEEPDLREAPLVRSLAGIIRPDVTVDGYREHLRSRYDGS
jgi:hypothetical protein